MSIKRHTAYNLCGSILPMFVSLLTVPAYLHLIGNDRYGVLAIVWLFMGYFGLFDPGITKAAEFHLARLHSPEQAKERESVFWTALGLNLAFGAVGGIVLYVIARPIFMSFFKMPASMHEEVIASLPWLAASIPISTASGVLGGALQSRERFGFYNAGRLANSTIAQLAPLAVAFWHGPDLRWLIPTVLIARAAGNIPTAIYLIGALPMRVGGSFDRRLLKSLFSYGGWIAVSNILNPVLSTLDRMLIGSVLSAEAVAHYTVSFNLVGRLTTLPGALQTSIFPKLSRSTHEDSARLASDAVASLAAVTTPIAAVGIAILPIFMRYWVGRDFAAHAAPVGIILLLGMWINGLAYIPYGRLQASGRPDIVAKFHAVELLPFVGILWVGLHYFGLIGAAYAWTLRAAVDAVLLFMAGGSVTRWRLVPGGTILIIAGITSPTVVLSVRTAAESAVVALAIMWSWSISPAVRTLVRATLRMKYVRVSA